MFTVLLFTGSMYLSLVYPLTLQNPIITPKPTRRQPTLATIPQIKPTELKIFVLDKIWFAESLLHMVTEDA